MDTAYDELEELGRSAVSGTVPAIGLIGTQAEALGRAVSNLASTAGAAAEASGAEVAAAVQEAAGTCATLCGEAAHAIAEPAEEVSEECTRLFATAQAGATRVAASLEKVRPLDIIENLGEAALEAGTRLAGAMGEAAEDVGDAAADVAEAAPGVLAMVGGSIAKLCKEFSATTNLYSKAEVIRDFYQIISLYLTRAGKSMVRMLSWFTGIAALISVDFNVAFPEIPDEVYYIVGLALAVLALVLAVYVVRQASSMGEQDRRRDGHEFESWKERAEKEANKVRMIKYGFLALTSVYLPLTHVSLLALICKLAPHLAFEEECPSIVREGELSLVIAFVAVLCLLIVTIGLPYFTHKTIEKNKPVGSLEDPEHRYNAEGDLVEYNDQMYAEDLVRMKHNPYLFLFKDYERDYATYKVYSQMVYKAVLLLPVLFLRRAAPAAQIIASLVLAIGMVALAFKTTPFLDDELDLCENISRVTICLSLVVTLLIALLDPDAYNNEEESVDETGKPVTRVLSIILTAGNSISFLAYVCLLAFANKKVKIAFRNAFGILRFSDSVTHAEGSAAKVLPRWRLETEVRLRLWAEFWMRKLRDSVGEEAIERLEELRIVARDKGQKRIRAYHEDLAANPDLAGIHQQLCTHFEGVDVYFDDERNGTSNFCKLWIQVFPFTAALVPDEVPDHVFFVSEPEELRKLLAANKSETTVRRRNLRVGLRGLSGALVDLPHDEWQTHTVQDGTRTVHYTDSDGNRRTRQEPVYSKVRIRLFFERGVAHLADERGEDGTMRAGFTFTVAYSDGKGQATKPRTGEPYVVNNGTTTLTHNGLGLDKDMEMRPGTKLETLFERNADLISDGRARVVRETVEYRRDLLEMRQRKEALLPSSFLYFVFLNDKASPAQVRQYFKDYAPGPALEALGAEEDPSLQLLYDRLDLCRSSKRIALWNVFFIDVWQTNCELSAIKKHEAIFNPDSPHFLGLHYMSAKELNAVLVKAGVRRKRSLFSNAILETLFQEIWKIDPKAALGEAGDEAV